MTSLIIHGGAWDIPDDRIEDHRSGCVRALQIGWDILRSGGTAVDAVEKAIRCLEDYAAFDAGRGSHLNADGFVELDASIMNGRTLRCGAVAAVRRIRNPISLARAIMDRSEHILLVGEGAERFAEEHAIALCRTDELVSPRERAAWHAAQGNGDYTTKDNFRKKASDTVGAVAMDERGDLCVGTSTGGTFRKHPGRVGDSPLIGCGSYADNAVGGVSTTGWGEAMIKVVMAKTVCDILEANGGNPQAAADRGIDIVRTKADGYGGVIVLNHRGDPAAAFNTPRMARGYMNARMEEPVVLV